MLPTLVLSSAADNMNIKVNINLDYQFIGISNQNYTVEVRSTSDTVMLESLPAYISIDYTEFYTFRVLSKLCSQYNNSNTIEYGKKNYCNWHILHIIY